MVQTGGGAALGHEAPAHLLNHSLGEPLVEERLLDRHLALAVGVPGASDDGHGASAQFLDQLVGTYVAVLRHCVSPKPA